MTEKELAPELRRQVVELIRQNRKIQAVKVVQEATKWGLKNSKDAVDAISKELKG